MINITKVRPVDPRRYLLAAILGLFALYLIIGGVRLLSLGGSAYYAVAGAAFALSSYFTARGDRRGIWVYLAMLLGTLLWALAEGGLDPWRLQSRLAAQLVLGFWVAWPMLLAYRRLVIGGFVAAAALGALALYRANILEAAPRTADTPPQANLPKSNESGEWSNYGNDLAGTRFSPLTQITPENVAQLKPAWTYRTGVSNARMGFEATPLMVNDTVYLCTSNNIIIALDPETGAQRWRFDPKTDSPPTSACRGVSHYRAPNATGECASRIIFGTADARLMAVDAATGALCSEFGVNGTVDLKRNMGEVKKGYYYISSAPAIVRGKVVVGGWVMDGQYIGEPSGVIRAFDAVTGQFAWAWDMDKPDFHGEPPPGEIYSRGTANSWSTMSGDEKLGLVYVPTGNSTPDYWAAHRSAGSEKYGTAIVALDISTGQARWSFQAVHHDLWDYDVSPEPALVDLPINGESVPALVQATKDGQVYLLDRRDGKPLATIEERPVPQGAAVGDRVAPTQPFSTGMPAFDNTVLTEQHMWGLTVLDQLWCRIKFKEARYEGPFTPPNVTPSITYPSYLGGVNWGGVGIDPERRLMVVNYNRMANYTRMVPRSEVPDLKASVDGGIHVGEPAPQLGTPYALFTGPFLSPIDVPCNEPPFGKIAVVDLDSRKVLWDRALGTSANSGPLGTSSHIPLPMGVPNAGGSVITRSGLIFIAATQERAIRAFDAKSGQLLWRAPLPAGGHAGPSMYISSKSGRQFLVISAGGSAPLHSGTADYVMAYALPAK